MRGKQRGQFLVSCSNGNTRSGQIPSLRVRLASSGVTVALIRTPRHGLANYIRNNPASAERKMLVQAMDAAGYGMEDVHIVLKKDD